MMTSLIDLDKSKMSGKRDRVYVLASRCDVPGNRVSVKMINVENGDYLSRRLGARSHVEH